MDTATRDICSSSSARLDWDLICTTGQWDPSFRKLLHARREKYDNAIVALSLNELIKSRSTKIDTMVMKTFAFTESVGHSGTTLFYSRIWTPEFSTTKEQTAARLSPRPSMADNGSRTQKECNPQIGFYTDSWTADCFLEAPSLFSIYGSQYL